MGTGVNMETAAVMQSGETKNTKDVKNSDTRKSGNYGKTIGEPKLSEKAQKYYDELKSKYSNMDFILVSEDKKAMAQSMASAYANPAKMVVLIDEDKIERMSNDENYRRQYESIISSAGAAMPQLQQGLSSTGANVKGYGMKVNDNGTASYFAVIDKAQASQRERIAKKAEEKREAKKADAKKAAKEKEKERLSGKDSKNKINGEDSDTVTITASSIEELLKKVNDYVLEEKANHVQTEAERQVGQNFDFKL